MKAEMKEEGEQRAPNSLHSVEETSLRRTSELINSVLSSSDSIRSFPVKWRLIRDKLEQLYSGLTATTGGSDSDANSELTRLLEAITSTAKEANVLAGRCGDESYSGGKLQLRSDLDVVAAKLELHIKRLAEIYASGILMHSQAIIVSRPGAGASREEMRFYVNDLFARLKIRNLEMKAQALDALSEVLREDEKYVKIVVMETADGVSLLVSLLEFGEVLGIQEAALEAVSVVAGFDSYRGALVMNGVVAPLIRVLEKGSELGKERAARALKKLTENSDNAWSVSAQGGVTVLLRLCGNGDSGTELIRSACGILKSLSSVEEIRRFMVEEGAISVFVNLSRSKEVASQIQAIEFLITLACDDDDDDTVKQAVVREGLIDSLVQFLDPNSAYPSKAREVALRAIERFCYTSSNSIGLLLGYGFLNRVLFFLRNGETSVQESALKAASRLCGVSEEAKKAMGDAGFMPELVKLLEAGSFEVREMAAEALCGMVSVQRNRRRFIQEDHNVSRILQLLNPEEKSATKKFLLSAVMLLTDSSSGRRKISASGYVKHLEKLAETDVKDARKILKKLSSSRFRSILTGIWRS